MKMIKRHIAIGDIHGCADELTDLISMCNFNPKEDRLLFVGDYVDRGPKNKETLAIVREYVENDMADAVLGNHDERYTRYFTHLGIQKKTASYKVPMKLSPEKQKVYDGFTTQELEFLLKLPTYITFVIGMEVWVLVHAGLQPDKLLIDQDEGKMRHIRYIDHATKKCVSLRNFNQPENSGYWTEFYNLPYNVVYGHNSKLTDRIQIEIKNGKKLIGLDTACCFGGWLSAYVLETGDKYQIGAYKQYTKRLGDDEC